MFSIFHKSGVTFIIRSANIVSIVDALPDKCNVTWEAAGEIHMHLVDGTAADNYARLQEEEILLMDAAERRARRAQQGYPMQPVQRGRS